MDSFSFRSRTQVVFGKGKEENVGHYAAQHAKKVLIHYGGDYLVELGILSRIEESLRASGVEYVVLDGVVPNPRLSLVRQGVEICRKEGIELILAVGGGSAIDSSKAIALGVPYQGDVWDFYTGSAQPQTALPVGVVLTIPGSGSEMSESSIITNEDGDRKSGIDHPLIVPEFAIMNPEMCFSLPPFLLAAGLADVLCHQMERYFTATTSSTIFTDRLIEGGMQAVLDFAPQLVTDPHNYDLCAEFMWAATLSHNGTFDVGRSSDWGSHRIEHEISALYDITHGAGMAIIAPAWMRYVKQHNPKRFTQLGRRVFHLSQDEYTDAAAADRAIDLVETFFRSLGLKTRLSEAGIPTNRFAEMAQKAVGEHGTVGRFQAIDTNDIIQILSMAV